jgi:hypothetical protein
MAVALLPLRSITRWHDAGRQEGENCEEYNMAILTAEFTGLVNQPNSAPPTMTMTCRIDRVVGRESLVVLFVSGCVTGEHVDMFRGVMDEESPGFAIDLGNVLLVDREAVKLLALREANGTELRNCPPYVREWVTRERAEPPERLSEQGLEGREGIEDAC